MKNKSLYLAAFAVLSLVAFTGQAQAMERHQKDTSAQCAKYANPEMMTHARVSMSEKDYGPHSLPYPISKAYRE